jgi:Rha family phage regulatory protein
MNELQVLNHEQTINSREVAEMMARRHGQVLKMIEGGGGEVGIIKVLTEHDFVLSDYFIESSYKDSSGKSNKCYECTKMGCEMLANKLTGEKGILFTAKYVKRFNEMEQHIKAQTELKVIDDTNIQTLLNSVEHMLESQHQEIEEIKSLIGLRSKEVYNYGNQIKKHLGISKISENPQDYENIKNMFFHELGGYNKWEQIPYSRDNVKLLQEICNDYKPCKNSLWNRVNNY